MLKLFLAYYFDNVDFIIFINFILISLCLNMRVIYNIIASYMLRISPNTFNIFITPKTYLLWQKLIKES